MKKISEENTFMAVILTESGASFNEDGIEFVHDMIVEEEPELKDKAIIALMGETIKTPEKLAEVLEKNPETFVVMSYDGGKNLSLCDRDDNREFAKDLRTVAGRDVTLTSWDVIDYKLGGADEDEQA